MDIDITSQDWVEVENLTSDKTYTLQAKTEISKDEFIPIDILFTRTDSEPESVKDSFIGNAYKFKKDTRKVFIKSKASPISVHVEEV